MMTLSAPRSHLAAAVQPLHFALVACSLGQVLVACTTQGVACVLLGDTQAQLEQDLRSRFPSAPCQPADAPSMQRLRPMLEQVVAQIEHPQATCEVALDVRGTEFQQRVWRALQTIPMGHTVSYAQLAQQLGQPTAARAVAAACAANPVAVLVPCHRVVRSDGQLAGYRWGLARKQALLMREGVRLPS